MARTAEQAIATKIKRREAAMHFFGVFLGLMAAAVMLVFLGRLIKKRYDDKHRRDDAVQQELVRFGKQREDEAGKAEATSPSGRAVQKPSFVDMTRRDPEPVVARVPAPKVEIPVETQVPPPTRPASEIALQGRSPVAGVERLEQKLPAVESVLKEYFEAGSVSAMLPLVRDSRHVRPLMEEYYLRHPIAPRTWKGISRALSLPEPGFRFAYVTVLFENPKDQIDVIIEETDAGFLLDWESSVRYSELEWKVFLATRPAQPRFFRVVANKVEESSAAGGAVLRLERSQEPGSVIGRFDVNDPQFRPLVKQLDTCNWKDTPVILRLCFPGSSTNPNEVQIVGVEGMGWLILGERVRSS